MDLLMFDYSDSFLYFGRYQSLFRLVDLPFAHQVLVLGPQPLVLLLQVAQHDLGPLVLGLQT